MGGDRFQKIHLSKGLLIEHVPKRVIAGRPDDPIVAADDDLLQRLLWRDAREKGRKRFGELGGILRRAVIHVAIVVFVRALQRFGASPRAHGFVLNDAWPRAALRSPVIRERRRRRWPRGRPRRTKPRKAMTCSASQPPPNTVGAICSFIASVRNAMAVAELRLSPLASRADRGRKALREASPQLRRGRPSRTPSKRIDRHKVPMRPASAA